MNSANSFWLIVLIMYSYALQTEIFLILLLSISSHFDSIFPSNRSSRFFACEKLFPVLLLYRFLLLFLRGGNLRLKVFFHCHPPPVLEWKFSIRKVCAPLCRFHSHEHTHKWNGLEKRNEFGERTQSMVECHPHIPCIERFVCQYEPTTTTAYKNELHLLG